MLNMCSMPVHQLDDRSTRARIRDAAITCFAEHGITATTARKVAAAAAVSPGSVIHHFGSMEGLRTECDRHVAARIRELKSGAMAAGSAFDPLQALRAADPDPPLAGYLARTLTDGSPHVADLVDELVQDAVEYTRVGVDSGMLMPSRFPEERAAILTVWSLGALVLHEHLERLIGVDITGRIDDTESATAYVGPALELLSGLLTDSARQKLTEAFVDPPEDKESHD